MSSKLGTILSLIFVVFFVTLSADLISLQYLYSDLDAKSVTISYLISEHGSLDRKFLDGLELKYNVEFLAYDNQSPLFGDEVTFVIGRTYKPLILSKETMSVQVERTTVIGYYH